MKKFSLWIMVSLLASMVVTLPALASYRPAASQAQMSDEERKLSEEFYNAAYKEKNLDKAYPLAKQLMEKYPNGQYAKYAEQVVNQVEASRLWQQFQSALSAFYAGADAAKLDQLISAGEGFLKKQPDQPFVVAQLALATSRGVMGQFYKDTDKTKTYAEKALRLVDPTTPPKDFPPDQWKDLRNTAIVQLNQYQAYAILQSNGDPEQAIGYINKALEMKGTIAPKDQNNYWLRANANYKIYEKMRADYNAMPKDSEQAKAQLAKIDPVIDRMIDDYARVVAITKGKAEMAQMHDAAKGNLEDFWKYRHDGKLDGLEAYVKRYEADPTAAPPTPSTAATSTPAPQPAGGNRPNGRPRGR